MKKFHFMNTVELEKRVQRICDEYNCRGLSSLIRRLFSSEDVFLYFIKAYCHLYDEFRFTEECIVDRKVWIPVSVFRTLKSCHNEHNQFSIALIWRSVLLEIIERFEVGGWEAWEEYKNEIIESCRNIEQEIEKNQYLTEKLLTHMVQYQEGRPEKIAYFDYFNKYLGYLLI